MAKGDWVYDKESNKWVKAVAVIAPAPAEVSEPVAPPPDLRPMWNRRDEDFPAWVKADMQWKERQK